MPEALSGAAARVATAAGYEPPSDYTWTKELTQHPLQDASAAPVTARVMEELERQSVVLPGGQDLVRRCVHALLVGHLVLQGPPGTGKTTLARALAHGFRVDLEESTATSDWSPFHVVGGFRPSSDGGLTASHGKVSRAVLLCAESVRSHLEAAKSEDGNELSQATWLLIDEFNRADIDKAIGSLYTVLSTCDPQHLYRSPIDMWFESEKNAQWLWIPARFRIIAAMNDLDTSFVNRMSQGLTRRFQFVTVGVPTARATEDAPITEELDTAFAGAHSWLERTYSSVLTVPPLADAKASSNGVLVRLQTVIDGMRSPSAGGRWPVGTAQVVDVLRVVMLQLTSDHHARLWQAVDHAIADRIVPQMGGIDDEQVKAFEALFDEHELPTSLAELRHLVNPHDLA